MNLETIQNAEIGENHYDKYQSLGGIFDKKEYENALNLAKDKKMVDVHRRAQAKRMARVAGIELKDEKSEIDPRVALYSVLREHNMQMTDEPLFAEVLKMLGDTESLEKFLKAYPHIFPEGK